MVSDDFKKVRKRAAMSGVVKVGEILRRWDPISVQSGGLAPEPYAVLWRSLNRVEEAEKLEARANAIKKPQ